MKTPIGKIVIVKTPIGKIVIVKTPIGKIVIVQVKRLVVTEKPVRVVYNGNTKPKESK